MKTFSAVLAIVVAWLVLTACSSSTSGSASDGSGGTHAAVPKGAAVPSAAAAAIPGLITPAQELAYCKQIPLADVQALLVPKIQKVESGPTGCAFERPGEAANGDNVTVDFRVDKNESGYQVLSGPGQQALPGVGDKAYWNQPVAGQSASEVSAHQGDLLCIVQPPAEVGVLTIQKTGTGPIYQISTSAARAFAVLMGKVCSDLFSVAH